MESGLRLSRGKGELNRDHVNSPSLQQYVCRAIACSGKAIESTARPAGADSVHIRAGTIDSKAAWSVSARQALPWCRADGRSNGRALAQQTAWQPPMSVHRVMPMVELNLPFGFPDAVVNIAHFQKLDEVFPARWTPSGRSK
jgi:hypothetical protein